MNRVELLAPAGSLETLKVAVNAGADAVYVGGQMFGARAYADNFDNDELIEAIEYAHVHNKKVYLTVNTLLKDKEIEKHLYEYIKPLYENGLDAVIVQDIGVLNIIKTYFSELPIHASTQMALAGAGSVKLLGEMGVSRIVTPRELSLDEIKNIRDNTDMEIESFVHGALCYCYSGQCLFSSIVGGRSGNRGRCAQPCRLPYDVLEGDKVANRNEKYVISPKDMCTLELLPDIIESGVYSLKIEGRMKKPEYTAGVVRIYRKYIDRYLLFGKKEYQVSSQDIQDLYDIFNRNGFNKGYYNTHNGRDMLTLTESKFRMRNEMLNQDIINNIINNDIKETLNCKLIISKEKPAKMVIEDGSGIAVEIQGGIASKALNQPVSKDKIMKQVNKTGNTPYEFASIEVSMEDDVFIPIGEINKLRRDALAKYKQNKLSSSYRMVSSEFVTLPNESKNQTKSNLNINCLVSNLKQLKVVLKIPEVFTVYVDVPFKQISAAYELSKGYDKKMILALPNIFRDNVKHMWTQSIDTICFKKWDGYLIRTLDEYYFIRSQKALFEEKLLIFDYTLYGFNKYSRKQLEDWNCKYSTLPIELNSKELFIRGCSGEELVAYGKIPMMISANCIQKTLHGCNKNNEIISLRDRYSNVMQVRVSCDYCYNIIYNSKPISLLDKYEQVGKLNLGYLRIDLTFEDSQLTKDIIMKFVNRYIEDKSEKEIIEFTRGHFTRGVE